MSRPVKVPGIPAEALERFALLQQESLIPLPKLAASVETYRQAIAREARVNTGFNAQLGEAIGASLIQLLGRVNELTEESALRVIQAAVRYYIMQNEGQGSDLSSMSGFDDDAHLVNAVLRYYGRDDLCVAVPETSPVNENTVLTGRRRFAMPPPRR